MSLTVFSVQEPLLHLAGRLPGCSAVVNNPKDKLLIIHDYNESGWLVGMHIEERKKKTKKITHTHTHTTIGLYAGGYLLSYGWTFP